MPQVLKTYSLKTRAEKLFCSHESYHNEIPLFDDDLASIRDVSQYHDDMTYSRGQMYYVCHPYEWPIASTHPRQRFHRPHGTRAPLPRHSASHVLAGLKHIDLRRKPCNTRAVATRRLDSNALVCDCRLMWLAQMVKEKQHTTQVAATCHFPSDLQGKSLTSLNDSEFQCRGRPHIREGPADVGVRFGSTAYFTCQVEGDPEPEVTWLHNNEVINDISRYNVLHDGTLMIENTQDDDFGFYECMATNYMGEVKSRKAKMAPEEQQDEAYTEPVCGRKAELNKDLHCIEPECPNLCHSRCHDWKADYNCGTTGHLRERANIRDQVTFTTQDLTHAPRPDPSEPLHDSTEREDLGDLSGEELVAQVVSLRRELASSKGQIKTYSEVIDELPEKRRVLVEALSVVDTVVVVGSL
ncbi:Peroxidasin [Chionoecetes opilio]|uniref:Peroxidasin n=1 Tax=Chionoecetes opilio TaxID=41210 RepID=A0A8J5CZS2_CHIOP|nr:Peroxidasin [Chionoecetes opilio]